jgi:hypothetical protein
MVQPNMTEDARLQQLYARRVADRGGGDGNSCVSPEAILAVVQREGPEPERLATLGHVMSCAACHREYQWLTAVDQAGVEMERATGGGQRQAWWRGTPLAMAASLAALGAAVVLSNILRPGAERERGLANDIALIAPKSKAMMAGRPITFSWSALPGASRYVLEVQRPDGGVVLADTTADTVVVMRDAVRLPPALYRWWVREVTDGAEPRSSAFREFMIKGP